MPALLAITVLAFASPPVAHAQPDITIVTVPIDKPNNPADGSDFGHNDPNQVGYGSVSYAYNIGKSEVTNTQYAIFLNSVAKSDPNGLYNTEMENNNYGGITRTGEEGSYEYTVKAGYANKPVNYVSFYDAARFCNWLTNGATTDPNSTETGMYTMSTGGLVTRNQDYVNANGGWAITSEDEWYKAAYYKLSTETYTLYATGNTISTDWANYDYSTRTPYVTAAGSYDPEQNGTFDMMGNVWEWTEAITNSNRGLLGGNFSFYAAALASSNRRDDDPVVEGNGMGFRIVQLASVVPEPSTYGILGGAAALLGAIALRRRNHRD